MNRSANSEYISGIISDVGVKKKNAGNKSSRKCVKYFFNRKIPELKEKLVQEAKNGDGKHYYSNQSLRKLIIIEKKLDEMSDFSEAVTRRIIPCWRDEKLSSHTLGMPKPVFAFR